ncbi:Hg(II)-responsive transcriptional regulator [Thiobacillus sp.]
MQALTISQMAREAGVNVETIRFYQRRGLLAEPDRPLGGIRRYGQVDVARVLFIKAAQRIGFTLDEVAQLLQLDDGTQCSDARAIAERKLADVRRRLADLQRIEDVLTQLVGRCAAKRGKVRCPLIDALQPPLAHDDA